MALGLISPMTIIAIEDAEIEDFDLKSLEEELKRLLEESKEEVAAAPEVVAEEKETLVIHPSEKSDEAKQLEITYEKPMSDALSAELESQEGEEEEVIVLDEIGDEGEEEEISLV